MLFMNIQDDPNNPLHKLVNGSHGTITDMLFEKMRSLIIMGELPSGYVFPIETVLCEQLNVGRSTLREVYKALSTAGYITRSKTGTYVNDRKSIVCATPLNISVAYSDINDVLEFRKMIESETSFNAAIYATEEDIRRIRNAMDMIPYRTRDLQTLVQNDIKFHQRIAEATHNKLIIETMLHMQEAIEGQSIHSFSKALELNIQERFGNLHQDIFDAIQNHRPAEATAAMRLHMEAAISMLEGLHMQSLQHDSQQDADSQAVLKSTQQG